jgi:hypothetical protein
MAARENQGLQIALIVFVMLTIILSVTTFIFYNNYKDQSATAAAAKKEASDAQNRERTIQEERNQLATAIGFPVTEEMKGITAQTDADFKKYADLFDTQVPPDQQNYKKLVEELAKTIDAKNKSLAAASDENQKTRNDLVAAQANFDKTLKEFNDAKAAAQKAAEDNQRNYIAQIAGFAKTAEQSQTQLNQKSQDLQNLQSKAEAEFKKLRDALRQAQETVQSKQGVIEGLTQAAPTVPDGRVSWVNQRDNTVFINVGADDGLQRRISFSVYDRNATDAATAVKKGSIEVLNIRGPHLAEARIMESTNSDPIVPGDIIYTPIWHPGQIQHFAIAGFIDFDNDQSSDLAKLRDLIAHNGGVIDAYMDEKGELTGRLSYQTNSLILGEAPTEKDLPKVHESFTALRRDSDAYGVPKIQLEAFLTQVGYSVRSVSSTANTSGPQSLRAPSDTPDRTKTSGHGFRERRPPSTNGNGAP